MGISSFHHFGIPGAAAERSLRSNACYHPRVREILEERRAGAHGELRDKPAEMLGR